MKIVRTVFCALLFAMGAAIFAGCATDNSDDISSVPWNQPQSWEGPMPSTINQGR